ncbi:MAG: Gfo/Idh/MocA family oxidoreductase [Ruminococcaceae bacterium]|nr:Gfo/Idh/MocA family oxidoreductase [Oscillospiraceae bacterium]
MNKNKLNIAVIGCSGMAQLHMQGILAKKEACLYAICDPADDGRLEKCRDEFQVPVAVADYRDLVEDPNIDAVVIVVPDPLHYEMTVAFLNAGKDVLCEKPMALTLEECEGMMRAEKESGRKLMIGQVCRCTPAFVMTKELIDAGRIGELFFVESEYAHDYSVARGYRDWRVTPEREGFIGGGCHAVDLLRWIAGDPTEVYAYANHKCLTDWPVNDCTIAIYQFPNNVSGKVFVSIGCKRNYTMRSAFYGTKGTIICDNTSPTITLFECGEPTPDGHAAYTQPVELPVEINNHNITAEIDVFVSALLSGSPMPVSSLEGASTVAVCRATVDAVEKKQPVIIHYPSV